MEFSPRRDAHELCAARFWLNCQESFASIQIADKLAGRLLNAEDAEKLRAAERFVDKMVEVVAPSFIVLFNEFAAQFFSLRPSLTPRSLR